MDENKQNTQEQQPAVETQVEQQAAPVIEQPSVSSETPVQQVQPQVDEIASIKAQLEEAKHKAQEEQHKRAILEARYQEVKGFNQQVSNIPVNQVNTFDDLVMKNADTITNTIIDNPKDAAKILAETIKEAVKYGSQQSMNAARFASDEERIISQIKQDKPHLAVDIPTIKANAAELLRTNQAYDVESALKKAAEQKHEVYVNFYKQQDASKQKPPVQPTGKGSEGISFQNFKPSAHPQDNNEEYSRFPKSYESERMEARRKKMI